MRRIFLLGFSMAFLLFACNSKKEGFEISGKIKNGAGKTIFLDELTTNAIEPVDSIIISENGEFSFSQKISEPKFYLVKMSATNFVTLLVDTNSTITITADADNLLESYTVEGSDDSKLIREINLKLNESSQKIDSLGKIFRDNQNNVAIDSIKAQLDSSYFKIFKEYRASAEKIIKENSKSLACLMALYQKLGKNEVFSPINDFKYFKMVDSTLGVTMPKSKHYKALHANVGEFQKMVNAQKQQQNMVGVGSLAPEISLPNPNGKIENLSDFKGQVVLLDFWAAWCRPCRAENPNLVANYKKYKKKGFEIFQVSLDKSKEDWVNAIKKDQLFWIHVSDLQYWNSAPAKLYNVNQIPTNFLIDKDGKIIARDLRGDELGQKLEEIFK